MKLKPILLAALVSSGLSAGAQTWVQDSVVVGPSSNANDVAYSLQNGSVGVHSNNNWLLAFQMTLPPQGPSATASVRANHAMGNYVTSVYSTHLTSSSFATLAAADTAGKTGVSKILYNSNTSFGEGAFNKNRNTTNIADYGWGMYNVTDHNLYGDSLYVVNVDSVISPYPYMTAPIASYKVIIQKYRSNPSDSIAWTMHIARFNGTGDTTIVIPRHANGYDFTDRYFAYYNATARTITDREPSSSAWDLLFTRYADTASQGPITLTMTVAGVFSNPNISVAEVHNINPDTAHGQNYTYGQVLNTIGYDWKHFNMSTYHYDVDSTVYFIKTSVTGMYYELQFTGYSGDASGIFRFRKRMLGTTSVSNIASTLNSYAIAPNPAQNEARIMIDAKEASGEAQVLVSDITGKTISRMPVEIKKGMNGYSINTSSMAGGLYVIIITNGSWKVAEKLVVQH